MNRHTRRRVTRHLPRMAVVTGIVVAVFGGLTLWLQDETFIKMKPTIVNGIFALILGFGLVQGRSYLKYLKVSFKPNTRYTKYNIANTMIAATFSRQN